MATVKCGNINCKYRGGSGFCIETFVPLNAFGCCVHWWDKQKPQPRTGMWEYAEAPVSDDETKSEAAS